MEANLLKNNQQPATNEQILAAIIDSVLDKKAHNVVSLNLTNLDDAVTDYLVICEGNSPTQVRAIAEHVSYNVKQLLGERPAFKEGFQSLEWVLVDYVNIMVHVFLKEKRKFYGLEDLWGDAAIVTHHEDDLTPNIKTDNQSSFLSKAD